MPWRDWQFWVVTLLALAAAWLIVRSIAPRLFRRRRRDRTRVNLTIGGERKR